MKIRTTGVHEDLGETGRTPRTHFAQDALAEVQDTRPDREAPAVVSQTVLCRVEGEHPDVIRVDRIAHEAARRVSIQAQHEEECQVVRVPKDLKALVADLLVRGGVHEDHDEQHEVPSDASRLGVVDVQRNLLPHLWKRGVSGGSLDIANWDVRVRSTLKKFT